MSAISNIQRKIISNNKEINNLKDRAKALPAIANILKGKIKSLEDENSNLQKIINDEIELVDKMIENKKKMHHASKLNMWGI